MCGFCGMPECKKYQLSTRMKNHFSTNYYVHFIESAPNAYGCNRDFFRIFGLKSSITLSVTFASIEQIWIPFPHFSVAALNISSRRQNKDPGSRCSNLLGVLTKCWRYSCMAYQNCKKIYSVRTVLFNPLAK